MGVMAPFDERVLKVVGDGKRGVSVRLIGMVGFSHNALRLRLQSLAGSGLVLNQKIPRKKSCPDVKRRCQNVWRKDLFTDVTKW